MFKRKKPKLISDKIQLRHLRWTSPNIATMAIQAPTKDALLDAETKVRSAKAPPIKVKIKIGVALLHPKDNFVKEIGRKVAIGDLKETEAVLTNIIIKNNQIEYLLELNDWNFVIKINGYHDQKEPLVISIFNSSHLW
jgi:hypothetical protein